MKREKHLIRRYLPHVIILICILLLLVMTLFPLYLLILNSFKTYTDNPLEWPSAADGNPFTTEGYALVWEYIKGNFVNSLVITLAVSIGTTLFGSMAGYAFARYEFPFKNALFIGVLAFMMVPGLLTLISRYSLVVDLGLNNNIWGVILPQISGSLPFATFLTRTFFQSLPPEMFEAARMDGMGETKKFTKLVVPLSQPIIITLLVQTFVSQWNDYLWSRIVLQSEDLQTLPVVLVTLTDTLGQISYCIPFAGYVLSAIPLVIIFIIGNKKFIEGMTSGAFKM